MRRRITNPPEPLPDPAKLNTRWTFDLETITPVLGGGVLPFEPDEIDIVRVPGIRGHLRWWWRALFATTEDLKNPKDLLRREASLWGGLPDDGPVRSPVRITVDILAKGQVVAAGQHKWKEGRDKNPGRYSPLPDWTDNDPLAYGLFPLMRDADFLAQSPQNPKKSVDTRKLRKSLAFRVAISFDALAEPLQTQLAATLWMWIHFGGIGARTRRGFGAIAVKRCELPDRSWQRCFDRSLDFIERLRSTVASLQHSAGGSALGERLVGAKLFIIDTQPESAGAAHGRLLTKLREFRQKASHGRSGTRNKPGPSHWPEANLLRAIYTKLVTERSRTAPNWEHPPPEGVDATRFGAPRAAFGLPLEIKFKKSDREDARASATIYPGEGLRWPSPLLLRPIAAPGGRAAAAMLILSGPGGLGFPSTLRIKFTNLPDQAADGVPIAWSMRGVASHLQEPNDAQKPSQNAMQAFWRFAQRGSQWQSVDFKDLPAR